MHSLTKKITTVVIGSIGVAAIAMSGLFSQSSKAAANSDNSVVTVATKAQLPGTHGPNFLYGRGMVTEHQQDSAYNGRLYATSENYVSGTPSFKIFESTDHGGTWDKISEVTDTQHGWGMRYQPFLYELPEKIGNMPEGTLICAGNSIPSDMSKTSIDLYKSNDHGHSWSFLSTVVQGGTATTTASGNGPVWEPFVTVINHQLVTYYSDERQKPTYSQLLAHQTSTDGIHWSQEVYDVADTNPAGRPGMATVAQMPNGKYIMTYEVAGEGSNHSNYKISDDGINWDANNMGTKLANGGSPYVTVLSDGTVVANSTGGNVLVNTNNGVGSWTSVNTPMGGAYSRSLTPLSNGQILLVNGGGYAAPTSNANHTLTSMVYDLPAQYHRATVQFAGQPSSLVAGKTADFTVKMSDSSAADFDVTTDDAQDVTVEKQADGSYQLKVSANYVGQKTVTVTAKKHDDSSFIASFKLAISGTAPVTPVTPSNSSSSSTSSSSTSSNSTASSTDTPSVPTTPNPSETPKTFKAFKVYAKRGVRVYKDVNFKHVVKTYAKRARTNAVTFTVTGEASSRNGALRYKTKQGYITANSKYVAKLYYQSAPKQIKVIANHGVYEYAKKSFVKGDQVKHVKKGTILNVEKLVKNGSANKFMLTNDHYITANKTAVIVK